MKVFAKAFTLILVSLIESCASFNYKLSTINTFYSNEQSRKFSNFKGPSDLTKTVEDGEELVRFIKEDEYNRSKYVNYVNNFFYDFALTIDAIYIVRTQYYATGNETNRQKYLDLFDTYNRLTEIRYQILESSYKSSYRDLLFEGMSDSEIENLLSGAYRDEETSAISKRMEEITSEAEELYTTSYRDDDYISQMFDLFVEYKDLTIQYEQKNNIDDYLSYLYKSTYARDYKREDIVPFYDAVKEKLVPAVKAYVLPSLDDVSNDDNRYIQNFSSSNFRYEGLSLIPVLEQYVSKINPLKRSYNHVWSNGYYCFSSSDSSLSSAYTASLVYAEEPLLYFSKNYQDVLTFVHELGHYTDMYYNDDHDSIPMDISEIHSQGNELLFISYLENEKLLPISDNALNYIAKNKISEQINIVFAGSYVAEVEQYLYDNDISNKVEALAAIHDISANYKDFINEKYCWAPLLSSPGYYISYATSSIGALELYVNSKTDFDKAADQYMTLLVARKGNTSIDSLMELSGLESIYSAAAVESIADYLKL